MEETASALASGLGTALENEDAAAPSTPATFRQRRTPAAAPVLAQAEAVPSHVLQSTAEITVSFVEPNGALRCTHGRFHWNGAELVLCSAGPAPWSGLDGAPVVVSMPTSVVSPQQQGIDAPATATRFVEFPARATSDAVLGVAPEYRAAAVRYLGSPAGHNVSDEVDAELAVRGERMHRLFITPDVPVVDSVGFET